MDSTPSKTIGWTACLIWAAVAAGSLDLAYTWSWGAWLVLVYLFALAQLARAAKWRQAFYPGLAAGLGIGVVHLAFFWRIFGGGAVGLWLVFAFWIAAFSVLNWLVWRRLGEGWGCVCLPILWCGLEYFRSELYYLKFAWLTPGYAFAATPGLVPVHQFGVYGVGFLLAGVAGAAALLARRSKWQAAVAMLLGTGLIAGVSFLPTGSIKPTRQVRVAGAQMEFPSEREVLVRLQGIVKRNPDVELLVLSEYTFDGPVPDRVRDWCRENRRWLVAGGKDTAEAGTFYNTAFVISPDGDVVFRQAKSVPIQFFKDGLPAPEQQVWNSPWGRIGICICYDLSYRRVTDRLVSLGAEALLVPTMDVAEWGVRQHELHGRVAPARAAEYGVPVFRIASSGISQLTDRRGRMLASAPCDGDGAILDGTLVFSGPGSRPLDSWLAPACTWLTLGIAMLAALRGWRARSPAPLNPGPASNP